MGIEPVTLENDFVRLDPLVEAHREALREAGADPDCWRFAVVNQHNANFDAWMDHRLREMDGAGDVTFTVTDKSIGAVVGSTSYLSVVPRFRTLEIGWTWYAKRVWAGAVNPACKRLLLHHAFETLGYNRVQFKVDSLNERSRNAVSRLGAGFEGILRAHIIMPDGRLRHSAIYSVLRDEWPSVRAGLDLRLDALRARAAS